MSPAVLNILFNLFFFILLLNMMVPVSGLGAQPSLAEIEKQLKILETVDPQKAKEAREFIEEGKGPDIKAFDDQVIREKQAQPIQEIQASRIEKLLASRLSPEVTLNQFGYDIFRETVSTFAPVTDVPVGPDYIIGPGDELTLTLWGMVEGIYKLQVSREGTVILPKVGVVSIAGLRFGTLRENLKQHLSKYYRDFNLNVSISNLRTMRIYVVGEIQRPGSYILSSLSTVYNALFSAGGPTKNGSLRNIQLIREGKVIGRIDLYEFLLSGDRSQDRNLQTGDTLFVPLIGPVVGVAGNVKRPAIYEFNDPQTLGGILRLAGGPLPTGYLNRVQVERVVRHERRVAVDFDLSGFDMKKKDPVELQAPAQNMDLIKVSSILDIHRNVVYLEGHVNRPGSYELKPGMRVRDLVSSFNGLLPEPYLEHGEIIRLVEPDLHKETISFDVGRMLDGDDTHNRILQSRDRVIIFERKEMEEPGTVRISGNVQKPGTFPFLENMTVKDLVFKAGNLSRNAFLDQAELVRVIQNGNQTEQERITVNIGKALRDEGDQNLILQPDDYLFVREIPEWYVNKTMNLRGEFRFPGVYAFKKGERLSELIERAGGYTEKAYLKGAVFTRQSVRELEKEQLDHFIATQKQRLATEAASIAASGLAKEEVQAETFQLSQRQESLNLLASQIKLGRVVLHLEPLENLRGTPNDIVLEDQDELYVPSRPTSVAILGAVRNPTSFLFEEKKRVDFYISKAGGYNDFAETKGVYVVRADGSATSLGHLVHLEPGDAVIVPAKVEPKYRPLPLWRDIATIVGQFALTIAAIATVL